MCRSRSTISRFAHDGGLITYGVDLVEHVEQLRKAYSDTYVFLRKGG